MKDPFDELARREVAGETLTELEKAILHHPAVPVVLYDQSKAEQERLDLVQRIQQLESLVAEQSVYRRVLTCRTCINKFVVGVVRGLFRRAPNANR